MSSLEQQERPIPNLIQQLQRLHSQHQSQQQISLSHDSNGDHNISSNSSLENNIDSFENRRRISYQDQVQNNQLQNDSRSSSRPSSQQQQNQTEQRLNSSIPHGYGNSYELEIIRQYEHDNSNQRRSRISSSRNNQQQQILQIKKSITKGICHSIMQFFFNYSLWLYLACNLIVIINQFINKSNRNFTLIFWTITSILFILIRLIQTCMMYQRESEDFTNLMRVPSQRSRVSRRSRQSRLYPRRQIHQNENPIPIEQIIQQIQLMGSDLESQNLEGNNSMIELANNVAQSNINQNDNGVEPSIQQIWFESFRQQMSQQGANSNVLILQQRVQQQIAKGLSKDEIKKLEKISFAQQELEQLSEHDKLCSICLEKYECDKKLIKLPCSHIYHNYCITKWLLQDHKCPLCRQDLKANS